MPPKYPLGQRSEREASDFAGDTSPTASSAARGKTNHNANNSHLISGHGWEAIVAERYAQAVMEAVNVRRRDVDRLVRDGGG
jgi:hypothetical protein